MLYKILTFLFLTSTKARDIDVVEYLSEPKDGQTCMWISASYGDIVNCQPGWVMSGVCGSGYQSDCKSGKYWYMIQCCDAGEDYPQYDCKLQHSKYGSSCKCHDSLAAYGGCGSGKNGDCKHSGHSDWNELECCKKDNLKLNTGSDSCIEIFGNHGANVECPANHAVYKVCGSGMWEDCSGHTTKVMCCSYQLTD